MLDPRKAIAYLRNELKRINKAIGHFEAIAAEQYADRESRAKRKVANNQWLVMRGKRTLASHFVVSPPANLNPDVTLWLN
jgi:hypothetical protein